MHEEQQNYLSKTVHEYGKGLLSFIRWRVKSDADAQDILQDIWQQLVLVVTTSPVEQTGAWLYKVARNKIIDRYRKKSHGLLDDISRFDEGRDYESLLFPEGSDPESEYLRGLFWKQLYAALEELPEEQRQVFIWQELEDIPFQKIADDTGVGIQTLVSRKRYAVLHLRKRLQQLYDELMD